MFLGINPPRVDERLTPDERNPAMSSDLGNELGAFPEPEDRFAFEDRKGQRQVAARPEIIQMATALQLECSLNAGATVTTGETSSATIMRERQAPTTCH